MWLMRFLERVAANSAGLPCAMARSCCQEMNHEQVGLAPLHPSWMAAKGARRAIPARFIRSFLRSIDRLRWGKCVHLLSVCVVQHLSNSLLDWRVSAAEPLPCRRGCASFPSAWEGAQEACTQHTRNPLRPDHPRRAVAVRLRLTSCWNRSIPLRETALPRSGRRRNKNGTNTCV
jgi:hypothetical protein